MKRITIAILIVSCVAIAAGTIDLENLFNYEAQTKPAYIIKDNTPNNNAISNEVATLGRVLFYDKKLSVNSTIACASCHQQQFAFGDTARLSVGLNGEFTNRHSMRLVNARFGVEAKFFWDERATSLEDQTTRPIQDHLEMGFSNTNGTPGLDSLIRRLENIDYYKRLFTFAFGDATITETRMQQALAQFVRSIQSFDSKYDIGRAQVNNDAQPFPNFTQQENQGKQIFLAPPPQGGAGCQGCHAAPEFDIDPNSLNNGVTASAKDNTVQDLTNTRAPSLRDLVNPDGVLNVPLMHNGNFVSLMSVINHYDAIPPQVGNTNLDPRLRGPNQQLQNLQLTQNEKDDLVAFLRTLTGTAIYTEEKWSNPFDAQGDLLLLPNLTTNINNTEQKNITFFPNPALSSVTLILPLGNYELKVYNINGKVVYSNTVLNNHNISVNELPNGLYYFNFKNSETGLINIKKVLKQ
jgi:cytochrome c peroxidase